MSKKVKFIRLINRILKYFNLVICYVNSAKKFIILNKNLRKKYRGDWTIGCYITLPKCGSSSMARVVGNFDGRVESPNKPTYDQSWFFRTEAPHVSLEQMKANQHLNEYEKAEDAMSPYLNLEDKDVVKNIFYFSVVRNPFPRLHGAWVECKTTYGINKDFKDFLRYLRKLHKSNFNVNNFDGKEAREHALGYWHCIPQLEQLLDSKRNSVAVNSIVKLENINEDLNKALFHFRKSWNGNIDIPHHNKTSSMLGKSDERMHLDYRKFYDKESIRIVEELYWSDLDYFDYKF